jgi:SAM-dependent methyltransferase
LARAVNDFDEHANSYERAIADAISFSGTDPAFFLELKAGLVVAIIRRLWGDPGTARLLDVGCGPGGMDSYLVERVASLTGLDTSERMVELAAAANPGAEYAVTEPLRLPYADASFDAAFASCVLHHIDPGDRAVFVGEMARVVAPGGLVVVLEHNPLNPLTRFVVSRCALDEGVDLLGPGATRGLLAGASAEPVESRYFAFFPWRARFLRRVEGRLGRLPLGAQYAVTGRRR